MKGFNKAFYVAVMRNKTQREWKNHSTKTKARKKERMFNAADSINNWFQAKHRHFTAVIYYGDLVWVHTQRNRRENNLDECRKRNAIFNWNCQRQSWSLLLMAHDQLLCCTRYRTILFLGRMAGQYCEHDVRISSISIKLISYQRVSIGCVCIPRHYLHGNWCRFEIYRLCTDGHAYPSQLKVIYFPSKSIRLTERLFSMTLIVLDVS